MLHCVARPERTLIWPYKQQEKKVPQKQTSLCRSLYPSVVDRGGNIVVFVNNQNMQEETPLL